MRLTKQTGHAIRILIDCARAGDRLIKVADISERLDITKQNVFKIAHILSRAGFISAVRGPSGGVKLARPATDIRIGDVVRAIEVTSVEITGDDKDDNDSPGSSGPISGVFDEALGAFIAVLDQHTLADLARGDGNAYAAPQAAAKKSKRGTSAIHMRKDSLSELPGGPRRRQKRA